MTPRALALVRAEDDGDGDGDTLDDDALMALSAGGDSRAFGQLVRRHEQSIRRFLARLVGDADAPDLAQECFVKLWQSRARYTASGRFPVLLYRVAKNTAFSHLRFRRVRRALSLAWPRRREDDDHDDHDDHGVADAPSPLPTPLQVALLREQSRATGAVLQTLKPELRLVVVLRHGQGLDYATIAEIVGISEDNARARAHRGLVQVQAALRARGEGEKS